MIRLRVITTGNEEVVVTFLKVIDIDGEPFDKFIVSEPDPSQLQNRVIVLEQAVASLTDSWNEFLASAQIIGEAEPCPVQSSAGPPSALKTEH